MIRLGGYYAQDSEGMWRPPILPPGSSSPEANWKPLLTEVAIDDTQSTPLPVGDSPSPFQLDARAAWQGKAGRFAYRVDAASLLGRPVYLGKQSAFPAGALDT